MEYMQLFVKTLLELIFFLFIFNWSGIDFLTFLFLHYFSSNELSNHLLYVVHLSVNFSVSSSPPEPPGQIQPNLAQSILG